MSTVGTIVLCVIAFDVLFVGLLVRRAYWRGRRKERK